MSARLLSTLPTGARSFLTVTMAAMLTVAPCAAEEPYTIEWIRQLGTDRIDFAQDVTADGQGNIYIGGQTGGSLGGTNAGDRDAFLAKFDDVGNHTWTRQFGTTGTEGAWAISADGLGQVYITGQTGLETDPRHFLAKYAQDGNLLWSSEDLDTIVHSTSFGVEADGSSNVYVTGFADPDSPLTHDSASFAYLAKYDDAGTVLWTREFDSGRHATGNDLSVDGTGNIYVAGASFKEGYIAGPDPDEWEWNASLTKYNEAGDLVWSRQLAQLVGTNESASARGVSADDLGNVYLTGLIVSSSELRDGFVAKYDADGKLLWTQIIPSSLGRSLTADGQGNVYVAGETRASLGGTYEGNGDAFVEKYGTNGDLLWTLQLGTSGFDFAAGVSSDGVGNIYVAGGTAGGLGGPHAGGLSDAFLVKLSPPPSPFLAGDYNNNGQVDQADLDLVLLHWGDELTDPTSIGWLNDPPDGLIDQAELDKVLLGWGNSAALFQAAGAAGVPEPRAMVLSLLALTVVLMSSRQSLHRR